MIAATLMNAWNRFLDKPREYAFHNEAVKQQEFDFEDFVVEVYAQRNGPSSWQRVALAMPKSVCRAVPGVVVPFYYPEAALGMELDTKQSLPRFADNPIMLEIVRRGWAALSADAYHLNYCQTDKPRDEWSRWRDAGEALTRDYPEWTGIGKLVADTRLLVDLLQRDERIDAAHLGIMGHSLGGKMAYYAGCLDERIKAVVASDFGLGWEQSNWGDVWYWGAKLAEARAAGLEQWQLAEMSGGKPLCILAGNYDNWESYRMLRNVAAYHEHPERLCFMNHATGHRPPQEAREAAYDFLRRFM